VVPNAEKPQLRFSFPYNTNMTTPPFLTGCLVRAINRRRLKTILPRGLATVSMLFVADQLFAYKSNVELSPLAAKSALVARVDGAKEINVVLTLPLSDAEGAVAFIRRVSTPGDSLYHRYLTPQGFADRFGGNRADYAQLKEWAITKGLMVTKESIGRINLTVRGPVNRFEELFKTQLNTYRSADGQEFVSASVRPTVPTDIASKVSGIIGLTESKRFAPLIRVAKSLGESPAEGSAMGTTVDNAGGSGPGGSYSAKDLRTAYSIPAFGNLDAKTVVAVFEQGGFSMSDVTTYINNNKLPTPKITPIGVNGSPTTVSNLNVELEAVLDIDMIIAINPAVAKVLVYEDSIDSFQTALLDAITRVGDDNKAQILSISYGEDEGLQGTDAMNAENSALIQLASEGITVLASSGDSGAYGDLSSFPYNVSDPSSQPYVTGVGGTSLYTRPGALYSVETAWNNLGVGIGASGGGISSYWSLPDFQITKYGGIFYLTQNGGSASYRNVPDVAAVGDPLTGVGVYSKGNGGWVQIGGTSVACPIWAGYLSIINTGFNYAGMGPIGCFNPMLYAVGSNIYLGYPSESCYDILDGTNGNPTINGLGGYPGFFTGPGYDNVTGNGSLWAGGLAIQLLSSGKQPGTPPGPIDSVIADPGATKVVLKWHRSVGATANVVSLYHADVSHRYNLTNSYLISGSSYMIELTGLTRNDPTYFAAITAINASGFAQNGVNFITNP
jgi:subtilase family serine protease